MGLKLDHLDAELSQVVESTVEVGLLDV